MTLPELTAEIDAARSDLFRIETLPSYATATSGDFQRWMEGAAEPSWDIRRPWLDSLTQWAASGRTRRRVRIIHDPPSRYEIYAADWGYSHNATAGESIRIIDLASSVQPKALSFAPQDWYLIDDRDVILMRYGQHNQFTGAQRVAADRVDLYRDAARAAWDTAEEFTTWWTRFRASHLVR